MLVDERRVERQRVADPLVDRNLAEDPRLRRRRIPGSASPTAFCADTRPPASTMASNASVAINRRLSIISCSCQLRVASSSFVLRSAFELRLRLRTFSVRLVRRLGASGAGNHGLRVLGDRPGDHTAGRRLAERRRARAEPRVRHRVGAHRQPALDDQVLGLVDRNARDAGALVDPAVAVQARALALAYVLAGWSARRSGAGATVRRRTPPSAASLPASPSQEPRRRQLRVALPGLTFEEAEQPVHQAPRSPSRRRRPRRPTSGSRRC